MRNLIAFLIKNSSWFLFITLELAGFFLVVEHNSYQRSIFFNVSNELRGRLYSVSSRASSYFDLRDANKQLMWQNAALQQRLLELEHRVATLQPDSLYVKAFSPDETHDNRYNYLPAYVLDNSISHVKNYITIDKGTNDGVGVDMGVTSTNGIVGFVRAVSSNYALIQSILNTNTQLNCKIKGSNIHTTLVWDTKDPRYATLKDFPRYEQYSAGDTIITSGISKFFPEGFIVGIIKKRNSQEKEEGNFITLEITLSTDFSSLKDVLVIDNYHLKELQELREEVGIE
jgi:rod shape-determining protein MreC